MQHSTPGSAVEQLRHLLRDALVRHGSVIDGVVAAQRTLSDVRVKVRLDAGNSRPQRLRRKIAVEGDVLHALDGCASLGKTIVRSPARRQRPSTGRGRVLESIEAFLSRRSEQRTVPQDGGGTVMTHAIEGKQVHRKVLDLLAERRDGIKQSAMAPCMPQPGGELALRVIRPAVSLMPGAAQDQHPVAST